MLNISVFSSYKKQISPVLLQNSHPSICKSEVPSTESGTPPPPSKQQQQQLTTSLSHVKTRLAVSTSSVNPSVTPIFCLHFLVCKLLILSLLKATTVNYCLAHGCLFDKNVHHLSLPWLTCPSRLRLRRTKADTRHAAKRPLYSDGCSKSKSWSAHYNHLTAARNSNKPCHSWCGN